MPPLKNKRHERFAQNIIKGLTQEQAYQKAGYTGKGARVSAAQLLTKPSVRARVEELNEKVVAKGIADAEEVRRFWTSVMRGEVTEERVYGKEPRVFTLPPLVTDRLKAGDSLAKALGIYREATEDEAAVSVAREWADALRAAREGE